MGLGCGCKALGDASSDLTNYDIITIGGVQYSANQIVGKTLTAQGDVPLFLGSNFTTPFTTVKAGQAIGQVYSYIRPDQQAGIAAGGIGLLMFYTADNRAFYVKDEAAISQQALQNQGTLTVSQENQIVQDEQAKANDPVGYYLKKYGLPALLIGAGIYTAVQLGKAYIDKPKTASA
jgi:hypothetical protein